MRQLLLFFILISLTFMANAQNKNTPSFQFYNSAERLLNTDGKILIGGYGEVHYNQPLSSDIKYNGTLDVHRMVLLVGYNFSPETQFISEIEFEHVSEVYIEQAFLQQKINNLINLRAGLLLIPMGIINEYHEPTTFNGVERPLIDGKIAPSTWREIGVGISGNCINTSLKYQAYVVNGFNSYNGKANLNGKNGLRSGRQKGAESFMSSPNLTGRIEYYAISGLNVGLSGYFGDTQSTLYNGISKTDNNAKAKADSSVVGMAMLGADARYTNGGLQVRGQFYYVSLSNTDQYNKFTAINGTPNDLGNAMNGFYIEAGYNVLKSVISVKSELIPFIRFENYNTHLKTVGELVKNKAYNNNAITTGITYKIVKGAVVKADVLFVKSEAATKFSKTVNVGIGVMF